MKQSSNCCKTGVFRILMFLIMVVMGIHGACAQVSKWDGSTKYTTIAKAGISGAGTKANPYILDNANKFVAFGYLANGSTTYWKLTIDIDLGNYEWPYGGTAPKTFKGHFDGDGHTVSNYKITAVSAKANALIGTITGTAKDNRAEIKNLKIDNVKISATSDLGKTTYIGALAGNVSQYTDLENVHVKNVKIELSNLTHTNYVGAFVGTVQKNSNVTDCSTDNSEVSVTGGCSGGASYIGGSIGQFKGNNATEISAIKGFSADNLSVTVNKVTFNGCYIGAIMGQINSYSTVDSVHASVPTVTYPNSGGGNVSLYLGSFTGGIYGATANQPTSIKNIDIRGDATVAIQYNASYIRAGFIGEVKNNVLMDTCRIGGKSSISVEGNLSLTGSRLGGFIGNIEPGDAVDNKVVINGIEIKDSCIVRVKGDIAVGSYIGGFVGYMIGRAKDKTYVKIDDVTLANKVNISVGGKITASSVLGGFVGNASTACTFNKCKIGDAVLTLQGDVLDKCYIGGAFGNLQGNATYPTSATGITMASSSVSVGTGSNNIIYSFIGIIGYVNTGVTISDWSISGDSRVTINGDLNKSYIGSDGNEKSNESRLGGFIGYCASGAGAPINISDVTIAGDVSVAVSGEIALKSAQLGGFLGRPQLGDAVNNKVTITNVKINGETNISVAKDISVGSYIGGFAGYIVGRAKDDCSFDADSVTLASKVNISVGGKITASSYIAGMGGRVLNGACALSNWRVKSGCKVSIGDNMSATCYIGGALGSLEGTANYPSVATDINIEGLDISLNSNISTTLYVGGIVGQLKAIASTPNKIEKCSVSGKIHTVGSHTFAQGNKTYAFGGIVGYTDQSATNKLEIKQCISEVDFDLSGFSPKTNVNLYQNGMVVGGVVGRLNTPSCLPEHVYYSGKIYAPFAVVAPIVGIFYTKMDAANYVYDDYAGMNASSVTTEEWKNTNSWYYVDYKIGLSDAVLNQTDRTRNYDTPLETDNGIRYLPVEETTFIVSNEISNVAKQSQTVLAYNVSGTNTDGGIYPAWNTNNATYPAYYMYYMQGVNRGLCKKNTETDFIKILIDKELTFIPKLTRSGDVNSGYVYTVDPGEIASDPNFTVSYLWYMSDKTTLIDGETNNTLSRTDAQIEEVGGAIYCKVTVSGAGFTPVSVFLLGNGATVVFVDGTNGKDNVGDSRERGWTPETPVKTINHANSLLISSANGGSWNKNIIVVMGMLNSDGDFRSTGKNPATLTGKWGGKDYKGVIKIKEIKQDGENVVNAVNTPGGKGHNCHVLADTKFEYLTFQANSADDGNNFIECHGNDVWFGKGLVMTNFRNLTKNHGNLDAAQNVPELTIVLNATNLNELTIEEYTNREKPQVLTIESGRYGRIMGGRYTNGFFAANTNTSHAILGSAEHPVWAVVNIDIDKENPNKGTVKRSEEPNKVTITNAFTCDINCIVAGLTDGSMYGDFTINVHGGKIGYIVGGNQGNPVPNISNSFPAFTQPGGKSGSWGQWPNASYFGRTIINVEQDPALKEITIDNLYTGGLGREANGSAATSIVDMYMYGHTEINIKSGTILGNVYGGGAGGVIGLNPWDMHVPYATSDADNASNAIINGVQYGEWGAKKAGSPLAVVTLHDSDGNGGYITKQQDLGKSSTTLNISGGMIEGSVYGGGCGYVSNMPEEVVVQGVGSVFGTSNVNISGGTIKGSVYGGSEGSNKYFGKTNKYNQKITHIAEMNGTVNMSITCDDIMNPPTIGGDIYGAGKGIETNGAEEYLHIATTGNIDLGDKFKTDINITIDMPESIEILNDIYGGGALGKVDGTSNIILKRGVFTGNIYGGGNGEKNHYNKAMINGNVTVSVGDSVASKVDRSRPVTITGIIYGGGNMARIYGDTRVNINHGNITADVFGGGKGLSTADSSDSSDYGRVTGDTHVSINNSTEGNVLNGNIYGGGALGAVDGNTQVVVKSGTIEGSIFGGGKGESGTDKALVSGNTEVVFEAE